MLDLRNVKTIMFTDLHDYGIGVRNEVFAPLLGNGNFTQNGPAWKHFRDSLRQHFVRTQYQDSYNFCDHIDHLV